MRLGSIVYTNYSPYENSGKILDYLNETFTYVFHFSIGFYNLHNKKNYNRLLIFKNGQLIDEKHLFQLPIPESLTFLLLPIRSLINLGELVIYSFWLKRKYGKIDYIFTVNAFIAWIGINLKYFGVVRKTIFWVWDYYPPIHPSKVVMLMRFIYWQFDRISSFSDQVAFVNHRLLNLRKDLGIYKLNAKHPIIPIATDYLPYRPRGRPKKVVYAFIGVLKMSQGPGIVFDHSKALSETFGSFGYEIIGSGPDEVKLKAQAKKSKVKATFHGYLEGESFNEVLLRSTIGIATYLPDPTNVNYFGDPGKIKRYICLGLPVICTDVLEFSQKVGKAKAGIVIKHDDPGALIEATQKIMADYSFYSENAYRLSQTQYYRKIYPKMFAFEN